MFPQPPLDVWIAAVVAGTLVGAVALAMRRTADRTSGRLLAEAEARTGSVAAAGAATVRALEAAHAEADARRDEKVASAEAREVELWARLAVVRAQSAETACVDASERSRLTATLRAREDALSAVVAERDALKAEHASTVAERTREARRQAALVAFGRRVVTSADVRALLDEGMALVAEHLAAELGAVFEFEGSRDELRMTAGLGWRQGCVGRLTLAARGDGLNAHVLRALGPVVVEALLMETRFTAPPLLIEHGVASGISAAIPGCDGPRGTIAVYTREPRTFSTQDAALVAGVAVYMGMVLERRRADRERRDLEALSLAIVETTTDAILTLDEFCRVESASDAADALFGSALGGLIRAKLVDLLPPVEPGATGLDVTTAIQAAFHRFEGIRGTATGRRVDGETFPVDVVVGAAQLAERRIFIVALRDLSELEQARAAQRLLEARLRDALWTAVAGSHPRGTPPLRLAVSGGTPPRPTDRTVAVDLHQAEHAP